MTNYLYLMGVVILVLFIMIIVVPPFAAQIIKLYVDGTARNIAESGIDAGVQLIEQSCYANAVLNDGLLTLNEITQSHIDMLPEETEQQIQAKKNLQKAYDGFALTDDEYISLIEDLPRWYKIKLNLDDLERICYLVK